ncbi:MAG: hypothetical protein SGPRY_003098 [Prymnesium sp.]
MLVSLAQPQLPITPQIPAILSSLSEQPNLVLEAPPGAGKTTAVPLALLDNASAAWRTGVILLLEPRRVAARAAATRIASLHGQPVGEHVGYRVRHESKGVSGVLFDEFHERSADADLCLALCVEAQREVRPELRLVVMSATLGEGLAERLSSLLGGCPLLQTEGRSFPVEVRYAPTRPLAMVAGGRARELEEEVAGAVMHALEAERFHHVQCLSARGTIGETRGGCGVKEDQLHQPLIWLATGEREIMGTRARLSELPAARSGRLQLLPLYGSMPLDEQQAIVSGVGGRGEHVRRVILATSIAESSLTVEGVRCVVDSGLRRTQLYDANTGMSALATRAVSEASAQQRAGRAGRLAPGMAFRLWSEAEHARLQQHTPPQIMTADLTPLVLQLSASGLASDEAIARLPWLSQPPQPAVEAARALLLELRLLRADERVLRITELGRRACKLPSHPRLAVMMLRALSSDELGSTPSARVRVAAALAAVLEERDLMQGGSRTHGADLTLRLRALMAPRPGEGVNAGAWYRAQRTMKDLLQRIPCDRDVITAEGGGSSSGGESLVGQLLAMAFPDRIAQLHTGKLNTFTLSNGRGASLSSKDDNLASCEYLVAPQLDGFDKRSARIHLAAPTTLQKHALALTEISPVPIAQDVMIALPHAVVESEEAYLVPSDGSVRARRMRRLGALIVGQEQMRAPSAEKTRSLLLSELRERGFSRTLLSSGEERG